MSFLDFMRRDGCLNNMIEENKENVSKLIITMTLHVTI